MPSSIEHSSITAPGTSAAKRTTRSRSKKPLFDDGLIAALTPSEDLVQSTGPADAAFFDGRLPLGYVEIPVDKLVARPGQPRTQFDDEDIAELAATIRSRGILEPILCRPLAERGVYEIVAGERRYRAALVAGLVTVPAIARDISDNDAALDALIENVQRQNLSAFEEAVALQSLLDRFDTASALASELGWDRQRLSNKLRILKLNPPALERVQAQPRAYSWRLLDAALKVQDTQGDEAAVAFLDASRADDSTRGSARGSQKKRDSSRTAPAFKFAPRATRAGGFRLSVHAPTRADLEQAITQLQSLVDTLERHVATDSPMDLATLAVIAPAERQ